MRLTLACHKCNQDKGNKSVDEFLSKKPSQLAKIKKHQKTSLSDAASVNSTRKAIFEMAEKFELPLKYGDGASTKMVRIQSNLPKEHWIDSACVATDEVVKTNIIQPLRVTAKGHGNRQSRRTNNSGFPVVSVKIGKDGKKKVSYIEPKQEYKHCTAGDYVKVLLTADSKSKKKNSSGKYDINVKAGVYQSRIKTPTKTGAEVVINDKRVSVKLTAITFIHRNDGYAYRFTPINTELLQDSVI
ncbi:MAG: hypothetical protein DSM106950_24870 [Stigonema ocellatum SAG 48.90 = DSM 106950]|nr:hypothetical protein [Stigonema ocellatum SAG 48.90 = DSM 106950]